MKRVTLMISIAGMIGAATGVIIGSMISTALADRSPVEQSGIPLVPGGPIVELERLDGTEYMIYPALIKGIGGQWTAVLLALEPLTIDRQHAVLDSIKAAAVKQ